MLLKYLQVFVWWPYRFGLSVLHKWHIWNVFYSGCSHEHWAHGKIVDINLNSKQYQHTTKNYVSYTQTQFHAQLI